MLSSYPSSAWTSRRARISVSSTLTLRWATAVGCERNERVELGDRKAVEQQCADEAEDGGICAMPPRNTAGGRERRQAARAQSAEAAVLRCSHTWGGCELDRVCGAEACLKVSSGGPGCTDSPRPRPPVGASYDSAALLPPVATRTAERGT